MGSRTSSSPPPGSPATGAWTPLGSELPPPGPSVLVCNPVRDEALLLVKGQGVEVWRWVGDRFSLVVRDFFADFKAAWPCGWFDPRTETLVVGAVVEGGLMVAPLERPAERTLLPFGKVADAWSGSVVAFDAEQGDVFALCGGENRSLCVWRRGNVVSLGPAPSVSSLTFDPERRRLVGSSTFETQVFEPDGSWRELPGHEICKATQVAWHPGRRSLVRLEWDSARTASMRLISLGDSSWEAIEPAVWLPAVRPGASLVCLGTGALLVHGGANGIHDILPNSTDTFVSDGTHDFEQLLLEGRLRLGRSHSLVSAEDAPLAIVDQSALCVVSLTRKGWQRAALSSSPPTMHGPHDDRRTVFVGAPGGVLYELDDDGGLWRARPGGLLEQVTRAEQGPGPRNSGYHVLAHDAPRRRLVLFGGSGRNDTWIFEERTETWREVLSSPRPPHGFGALCSTPIGVYLFVAHELWWLDDECWRCVGHDPDWTTYILFCDPLRRTLWSASAGKLAVWQKGKFREVLPLPKEVTIHPHPFSRDHLAGLDPLGDRLFTWDETAARVWPLASLGEAAQGELPQRARTPPTQRRTPVPRGVLRRAARLMPRMKASSVTKVPGVRVPSGYRLLAVVPRLPRILPLPEGVSGLAVMVPHDAFEAYEHTRVVQLTGEPPAAVWLRDGAVLRPCDLLEFEEIDPDFEEDFDTLPGHQFDHAFHTKVGGFGRFVQSDPEPKCKRCQRPMRFALQLGCEVFMVGDSGETYAYFCPRGCGASAELQTH